MKAATGSTYNELPANGVSRKCVASKGPTFSRRKSSHLSIVWRNHSKKRLPSYYDQLKPPSLSRNTNILGIICRFITEEVVFKL